jgi:hypothetical protein
MGQDPIDRHLEDGNLGERVRLKFGRHPILLSLPRTSSEITLNYARFKFPVLARTNSVPSQKFPVPLSREFCSKSTESLDEWPHLSRDLAQN